MDMQGHFRLQRQASIKSIDAPLIIIGGEIVGFTKLLEIVQKVQKMGQEGHNTLGPSSQGARQTAVALDLHGWFG